MTDAFSERDPGRPRAEPAPHDVFISHSSKDKATADAVCALLESREIRCWVASRDIPPGANWGEAIIDGLTQSRVLVLVLSQHANASPQVVREVERAVSKGIPIIPLRIEDVALSKSLEYFLSSSHWLDAFAPPLGRHLEVLAERVRALAEPSGPGAARTSQPTVPAGGAAIPPLAAAGLHDVAGPAAPPPPPLPEPLRPPDDRPAGRPPPLPTTATQPSQYTTHVNWVPTLILYGIVSGIAGLMELSTIVDIDGEIAGLLIMLTIPLFILGSVFISMLHYTCWRTLPERFRATTPGRAVGFLFIPLFNFYWAFVSWPQLVEGLHRWEESLGRRRLALSSARSLGIAYAVSFVCLFTIGLVPGIGCICSIIDLVLLSLFYRQVVPALNAALTAGAASASAPRGADDRS